jgi:hypothetical protein
VLAAIGMSGTADPNSVKNAIDAHSGRFEFFKQMLTLGLGGIAGIAVFFTDPTRVPKDLLSIIAVCVAGVALGVVVLAAGAGLSAYANLLTNIARANGLIPAATQTDTVTPQQYATSLVSRARWVFIATLVASLGVIVFASAQMFRVAPVSAEEAVAKTRAVIAKGAGQGEPMLQSLRLQDGTFIVTFATATTQFTAHVAEKGGEVLQLLRQPLAPTTPSSPPKE